MTKERFPLLRTLSGKGGDIEREAWDALAEIERLQALVDRMLWSMQKKAEMDLLPRAAQRCDYVGMYDGQCGLDLGHAGEHRLFGPHRAAAEPNAHEAFHAFARRYGLSRETVVAIAQDLPTYDTLKANAMKSGEHLYLPVSSGNDTCQICRLPKLQCVAVNGVTSSEGPK